MITDAEGNFILETNLAGDYWLIEANAWQGLDDGIEDVIMPFDGGSEIRLSPAKVGDGYRVILPNHHSSVRLLAQDFGPGIIHLSGNLNYDASPHEPGPDCSMIPIREIASPAIRAPFNIRIPLPYIDENIPLPICIGVKPRGALVLTSETWVRRVKEFDLPTFDPRIVILDMDAQPFRDEVLPVEYREKWGDP